LAHFVTPAFQMKHTGETAGQNTLTDLV